MCVYRTTQQPDKTDGVKATDNKEIHISSLLHRFRFMPHLLQFLASSQPYAMSVVACQGGQLERSVSRDRAHGAEQHDTGRSFLGLFLS